MQDHILVHDMGTTGNKAILVDNRLNLISSKIASYKTYYPKRNWTTQRIEEVWEAVVRSTKEVIDGSNIKADDIAVIGFSNQMMTSVPVDKDGNPLIKEVGIWCDARSRKQAERLCEKLGGVDEYYKITGCGWQPEISNIAKDIWLRENKPEIYKKTYKFLQYKEFVAHRLTGEFGTEYGDMSMSGRMNCTKREISEEIFEVADLDPTKVPKIHKSHKIIGSVKKEAANTTGLKEGTPVVLGSGDGICSCLGARVVREGMAYTYCGSASWTGVLSEEPSLNPEIKMNSNMIMPVGETYQLNMVTSAGGISQDWFKDGMYPAEDYLCRNVLGISTYEKMKDDATGISPGAGGLIFLPYLRGGGAPHFDINTRGAFIGLDITHNRAHMFRALLEGVAFNLRWLFDRFDELGVSIYSTEKIQSIGGGALSELWMQIYADVCNHNFATLEHPLESTGIGAAIIAGVGAGIWDDYQEASDYINIAKEYEANSENRETYRKMYKIYRNSYEALSEFDVFSGLQKF
jgi:xylulokinase